MGVPDRDRDTRTDWGTQNHLEMRLAGTFGFTQQDPQGDRAPHPAPGDECWVQSDLELMRDTYTPPLMEMALTWSKGTRCA